MKANIIVLAVFGWAFSAAGLALGQCAKADYCFNVASGDWDVPTNWTPTAPTGGPGSKDTVFIGNARACYIDQAQACKWFKIDDTGGVATLYIKRGGSLDLGATSGTSTVDGKLSFSGGTGNDPKLVIKNALTINGRGVINSGGDKGVIDYDTTNYRLTIDGTVTLSGSFDIKAMFTNSATVDADAGGSSGEIRLWTGSAPAGNGAWKITNTAGILRFDDSATALSGDFTVQGTLDIDADVTTSGELYFKQNGVIEVLGGKHFKASQ